MARPENVSPAPMSAMEEIAARLRSLPVCKRYVPEFGRDVYYHPITPKETALIASQVDAGDPIVYWHCETVLQKALDEQGRRLFGNADRAAMRSLPAQAAIMELSEAMQARRSFEDAKKN